MEPGGPLPSSLRHLERRIFPRAPSSLSPSLAFSSRIRSDIVIPLELLGKIYATIQGLDGAKSNKEFSLPLETFLALDDPRRKVAVILSALSSLETQQTSNSSNQLLNFGPGEDNEEDRGSFFGLGATGEGPRVKEVKRARLLEFKDSEVLPLLFLLLQTLFVNLIVNLILLNRRISKQ